MQIVHQKISHYCVPKKVLPGEIAPLKNDTAGTYAYYLFR